MDQKEDRFFFFFDFSLLRWPMNKRLTYHHRPTSHLCDYRFTVVSWGTHQADPVQRPPRIGRAKLRVQTRSRGEKGCNIRRIPRKVNVGFLLSRASFSSRFPFVSVSRYLTRQRALKWAKREKKERRSTEI